MMEKFSCRNVAASLALALFGLLPLVAQVPTPVRWSLTSDAASVKSGQTFHGMLKANIEDGWHLYSLEPMENGPVATQIDVPAGQAFKQAGTILAGDPEMAFDPNFQMDVRYYEYEAVFRVPVVSAGSSAGKQTLTLGAMFQTCNDHLCLPPTRVKLTTPVMLLATGAAVATPPTEGNSDT